MIKIEKREVAGWEAAIRGCRNPMNSWGRSDSEFITADGEHHDICGNSGPWYGDDGWDETLIGENDHKLMMKLRNAGTDHRKFMRMITMYCDITAPLYWWKEFDTYKVGTVANSCSTMHKIAAKEFELDDFSHEHLAGGYLETLKETIKVLNDARDHYINGLPPYFPPKTKDSWWFMIQLLPSSYNQKRTVMMNYEVLANIYKSRKGHRLDEWNELCEWIECLPYSEIITGKKED